MEYTLTRSNRKTLSISIDKDATLFVRAPKKMSINQIERFLLSKDAWIKKHRGLALERKSQRAAFSLDFGDMVRIRGKDCLILSTKDRRPSGPVESNSSFEIFIPEEFLSYIIFDTVRTQLIEYAKDYLTARTFEIAKYMEVAPSAVRIGKANSRWGSCNSQGRINYTWKVIMCEDAIIDYLIVHELSHLIYMNHSQDFWNTVQKFHPDYKESRKALKVFHKKLECENW